MTDGPERDLERAAASLGRTPADRLDLDRVADRVTARLRSGEGVATPARWWRVASAGIAAALLVVAGTLWLTPPGSRADTATQAIAAPALELLSADELSEVLDSLGQQAPVTEFVPVGIDDLTEQQLQELLAIMEG